jgi:hypothetical protein
MPPAKLLKVERTPNAGKQFKATFQKADGKTYIRRFGTSSNYVSNPAKTKQDRENYRKRHGANPKSKGAKSVPDSPFNLSMHILWGESRSLSKNVTAYKKRYGL